MGAIELDRMAWPEVRAELDAGRDTVVIAFGATEQHGPHLPLATDALIGDHLARLIADRLDAFVAPTVRIGCSEHHLEFPGTLSVSESTFHAVVADIVRSVARGGFRRIVLLPTHGGNFGPLAAALAKLGPIEGVEIRAVTDLHALFAIAEVGVQEHGVPLGEGGVHAGEWETSMMISIHPELVRLDKRQAGYTGDMESAIGAIFGAGVHSVAANGVIGDPGQASAEHGARYWEAVETITLTAVAPPG
ncbi:MAG TPA: creatininase family protein [Solirubrobacteraceae bacterium]|nr:creatininase family protein [Solirubrobacteraceae bacterium]